jgi:3-oxoacyl-[acyl-carrier-protein] synthase II
MFGGGGAFETIMSLFMMQNSLLIANKNLDNLDEQCADLDYVYSHREHDIDYVINNNFAFGGINTSIILKKF